jgi:DNA-binding beta-propeller fold protein YncE
MSCPVTHNQPIAVIGELSAAFSGPVSLACDDSGALYVLEEFGQRIKKYGSDNICLWERRADKKDAPEGLSYPTGICITTGKKIWVTNRWQQCIDVFTQDGTFERSFGCLGEGREEFIEPWGIACDPQGYMYIVDKGNARIAVYDADCTYVRSFGTCGIPVDFYESERFKRTIHYQRWVANNSRLNTIESRFHEFNYSVGDFEYPENIAIDPAGYIYVTDRVSKHVVIFDPEGVYCNIFKNDKNDLVPSLPSCVCAPAGFLCIGDELSGLLYVRSAEKELCVDLKPYSVRPSDIIFSKKTGFFYIADAWNDRVVIVQIDAEGVR